MAGAALRGPPSPSAGLTLGACVHAEVVSVGCVLDGVRYNNGQSFQPNCRYNCTCVGGAVGCTPLCLRAPRASGARRPRRAGLPGRCCERWVCEDDARRPRKAAPPHGRLRWVRGAAQVAGRRLLQPAEEEGDGERRRMGSGGGGDSEGARSVPSGPPRTAAGEGPGWGQRRLPTASGCVAQ